MINLTEKDKEIIRQIRYQKKADLSVGSYYIKSVSPERGLKELIGLEVTTQMGLICPRGNVVEIDGWGYLLSEDLDSYGRFINAEDMEIGDLIEEYCSIEEARNTLESKYNIGSEVNNLIKIYILDIIFKHFDRNKRNWGLILLPDGSRKLVILDNEYLLVDNDIKEKLKLYFSPSIPASLEEDFTKFLLEAKPEDIVLFEYYFNLYKPEFIISLINILIIRQGIKFENGEKEEIIESYQSHYSKLQDLIKKSKNIQSEDKIVR